MSDEIQGKLLVFSPNLAIDHIIELEQICLGDVQRAKNAYLSAGGKGVNVARASTLLEGNPVLVGLIGGEAGFLMRALLSRERLDVRSPEFDGETRFATILRDVRHNITTVLNERGPEVTIREWDTLLRLALTELNSASVLVCTGSLPPGVAHDGYTEIIRSANSLGKTSILDASGLVLASNLASRPSIIKVNLKEALTVMPEESEVNDVASRQRALNAAMQLRSMATDAAIVTISEGAALCCDEATVFLSAPTVLVQNEIGAGDSFIAGMARSLISENSLILACKHGVATAAASVETGQPGLLDRRRAEQLVEQVVSDPVTTM